MYGSEGEVRRRNPPIDSIKSILRSRGVDREVACNFPQEEQVIYRGGSRIYLSLDFSGLGVPKILTLTF